MKAGDVVRWTFVQGDGQRKMRPAIIIGAVPPFNDRLVCAISSQVQREVKGLDLLIDTQHPDVHRTGLKLPSLVRVAQLATLRTIRSKVRSVTLHRLRWLRSRSDCGTGWVIFTSHEVLGLPPAGKPASPTTNGSPSSLRVGWIR